MKETSTLMVDEPQRTTMAPGLYEDVPFKDYKAIDAVNNSRLTRLNKCPAAALVEQEETPSLLLGRAVHTLVLEGDDKFLEEFAIAPECNKRTNEGKATLAAFQARNLDKSILDKDDFDTAKAIRRAVLAHPFAKKILSEGKPEQTIIWDDDESGLKCKGRIDWIPGNGNGVLVDLKTTRDASSEKFIRSCIDYGYAKQAGMYIDGIMKATGEVFDSFMFIAVETEPPYHTEVHVMDMRFIEWGYLEYRRLLYLEAKCRKEGYYPHFTEASALDLVMPGYLARKA